MAVPQEPVFKREFEKFLHDLQNSKSKRKAAFIGRIQLQNANHTPEELLESVQVLMRECSDKRMRKWYNKSFTPVIDAIKDYTGVIDTMIQAYPMPTALIWGGLKIVLDCAGRHGQQFEKIKSHMETLQDHLWDLANCDMLYGSSPYSADVVRRLIGRSYVTILRFWYRCTKIIEHPMRYVAVTDHKLLAILGDLKKDSEELSKICERAEALLNQAARKDVAEEFVKSALERGAAQIDREKAEIERTEAAKERTKAEQERAAAQRSRELAEIEFQEAERERLAAKAERDAAQNYRQKAASWQEEQDHRFILQRTQALIDRMDGHNRFSLLLLESAKSERHPGTCEWILQHEKFLSWSAESTKRPIFWLHGRHGAGKSFICASAIEHISNKNEHPPIFQFLTKDHYVSRNQLLRNFAQQLLEVLAAKRPELPESLIPFLTVNKENTKMIEKLIQAIIHELPLTYIFLDGLDEADYTDFQGDVPIPRAKEEVPLFVNFLASEAIENPDKVRLWCSSQFSPEIQRYMYRHRSENIIEVPLQTEDTARDIQKYLLAAIPESTRDKDMFAGLVIAAAISTEVEGSFLWASSMLEDLKDRAEDSDDLITLAEEGLPTTMNDQYSKIIARIRQRDRGDKSLPLWKIVLSLIAFAKRPLRMSEIIEGVAMTRTAINSNLNDNKRVDADKILTSCMSLVRLIKSKTDMGDGLLRLSHSAVGVFLMKYSDDSEDIEESDQLVSSTIMRDCCLKYLLQPRYSGLLQKSTSGGFVTPDGEDVNTHQLVLYAAKYWDKHADTMAEDDEQTAVEQFLRSKNFLACIQIQSRYVIGHFVQNFDPITDQCRSTKRSLPLWMKDIPLFQQYFSFTAEWGELLQRGIYAQFQGEIDRCFWTALGEHHFLAKHPSRYRNFILKDKENLDSDGRVCRVQQVSEDGRSLTVCWIQTDREIGKAYLESWNIGDGDKPRLEGRSVQEFSVDDVRWALYSLPCSRSWPLVPDAERVDRPDAITLHVGGKILRIGSYLSPNLSTKQLAQNPTVYSDKVMNDAWEETQTQGSIIVVCRRRLPRKETSAGDRKAEVRRIQTLQDRLLDYKKQQREKRKSTKDQRRTDKTSKKMQALRAAIEEALTDESGSEDETLGRRRSKKKQEDDSDPEPYEDSDSSSMSLPSEPESTDEESDEQDGLSSPGESWSEASTNDEQSSGDDTFSQCSEKVSSGDEIASLKSIASDDESGSDALGESSDSDFDEDSEIESDLSEEEDAPIAQVARHESLMSYPVEITPRTKNVYCDWCWKKCPIRWYHCTQCVNDDFDLCHACVRQGHWCLDKSHQLFEMDQVGTLGVTSSIGFKLRQELKVFDTSTGTPKPLYHFSMKYDAMLHDSAPAIHPKHSLVVWPLSGSQLLFADFNANSYFEQKVKTGSGRSRPICVSLSFSPCGNLLRVATVDSTFLKAPKLKRKGKGPRKQLKPIMCLNLHVLILQLATSKPARSPPKLIATTTLQLGCGLKSHVQQLPFAFTWCESDLYFTMSSSRLRVYKIALTEDGNTLMPPAPSRPPATTNGGSFQDFCGPDMCGPCEPAPLRRAATASKSIALTVTVPKETIFLPRSARSRSVQFIPPHTPSGNSTVVIGPRNGLNPDPPIVVYFDAEDLGSWVDLAVKEGEESRLGGQQQRLEGRYETFDTEQDCDIIFV